MKKVSTRHLSLFMAGCVMLCIIGCKNPEKNDHQGKVAFPEIKQLTKNSETDEITGSKTVKYNYSIIPDSIQGWEISVMSDDVQLFAVIDSNRRIIYFTEYDSIKEIFSYDIVHYLLNSDDSAYMYDRISTALKMMDNDSLNGEYNINYKWKILVDKNLQVFLEEYNPIISDIPTFKVYADLDTLGNVLDFSDNQWIALQSLDNWDESYENRIRKTLELLKQDTILSDTI